MCDVNVLLAMVAERHVHHVRCVNWWKHRQDNSPVLICREVQAALLRLLSNTTVMGPDVLTLSQAWSVYALLLKDGGFSRVIEPRGLDSRWEHLCRPFKHAPKVAMDAYLAAFAISGGFTFVTLDRAFTPFDGLSVLILE